MTKADEMFQMRNAVAIFTVASKKIDIPAPLE
jgi:hypothetical protein